jgi:hypothetical protein
MKLNEATARSKVKETDITLSSANTKIHYINRPSMSPASSDNMRKINYKQHTESWDVLISIFENGDGVT